MSELTRGMLAAAASSPKQLTAGAFSDPTRLSWQEVHERATRMATGLAAQGVGHHGSVAVLASDAAHVAPLAQALWLRRAALTMLQQPTPRTDLGVWLADTVRAIRTIKADLVVVGEPFLEVVDRLADHDLAACTIEALSDNAAAAPGSFDDADESDIALRQLTSGSTGAPKAVEISHGNLAANAVAARDGLDLNADTDVMASWLPLAHDMGMIGFICLPMQVGIEAVVVPPHEFLTRPLSWAELISRHRATITAGPNFAYSVLARVLQRAEPNDIDLSSLRVAVNGAEPIDHRDVADFAAVGARFGLRPTAMMPAYGLAEATLVVSLASAHEEPLVDRVSRRTMSEARRAQPVHGAPEDPEDVRHLVSLGSPAMGMDVRIVRDGIPQAPREIGAIELRGPAVAKSYITSDGVMPLASADGWFDSGDLGYVDERGRIYVCGRTKDLIVLAGRNLYPHDIERAAEDVDGVRTGCVIALRIDGDREGFAVLAEVRDADDDDRAARISRDITARVSRRVGHLPSEVRLFPAGTLPKTSSGKLRRSCARKLLEK
ncbi:fatty acyl-AMP ligase [Mycobacterium spongiae]|uniref:AMP-binding protein n=1 Tax=Mycobacterium spongiae TaxID=886343 RepID=A0A975PWX1_9MYCO|nr:fatty acyl-AMP ligase [Mycobacterium spongiae]QUR67497.1 AMP-binding protein [Mycobacterium spongiae]